MGAYGSERSTQSLQDFPAVDSEEEAEEVTGSGEVRVGGVWAVLTCSPLCLLIRSFTVSVHAATARWGPVPVLEGGRARSATVGLERAVSAKKCQGRK